MAGYSQAHKRKSHSSHRSASKNHSQRQSPKIGNLQRCNRRLAERFVRLVHVKMIGCEGVSYNLRTRAPVRATGARLTSLKYGVRRGELRRGGDE